MQPEQNRSFSPSVGSEVIYGLHGRCVIDSIVERKVDGRDMKFFKLHPIMTVLNRTKKSESAIWIPADNAKTALRSMMSEAQAETALELLNSREYFFDADAPWNALRQKLDVSILTEGPQGLAKVYSCMYVLSKRRVVLQPEVARFYESVENALFRELSEVLKFTRKELDERIAKGLKSKLNPDS